MDFGDFQTFSICDIYDAVIKSRNGDMSDSKKIKTWDIAGVLLVLLPQ